MFKDNGVSLLKGESQRDPKGKNEKRSSVSI
jgi:hypothetical protein